MSDLDKRLTRLEGAAGAGVAAVKVTFLHGDEPEPENIEPPPPGVMHLLVRFVKPLRDCPHARC